MVSPYFPHLRPCLLGFVSLGLVIFWFSITQTPAPPLPGIGQQSSYDFVVYRQSLAVPTTLSVVQSQSILARTNVFLDYRSGVAAGGKKAGSKIAAGPSLRFITFQQCSSKHTNPLVLEIRKPGKPESRSSITWYPAVSDSIENSCPFGWAPNCTWNPHLTSVQLPVNFKLPPSDHRLVLRTAQGSAIIPRTLVKVIPKSAENDGPSKQYEASLAVCVPPLYLYADWLQLIQFVEIWRQFGAKKFLIYPTSVTKRIQDLLKMYHEQGIVEIVPWSSLPKSDTSDPNSSLYRFGLVGALNDCLFRSIGRFKYLALLDFDEFIIPKKSNDLVGYLDDLASRHPKAGSFKFEHVKAHYPTNYSIPRQIDVYSRYLFHHMTKITYDTKMETGHTTKPIVRPERVSMTSTHYARKILRPYVGVTAPISDALLYHLRRHPGRSSIPATQRPPIPLKSTTVQKAVSSFHETLISNNDDNLVRNGRKAASWPSNSDILSGVTKCLSKWRQYGCKIPHEMCAELLKDKRANNGRQQREWILQNSETISLQLVDNKMEQNCPLCHVTIPLATFGDHLMVKHVGLARQSLTCGEPECSFLASDVNQIAEHVILTGHSPACITPTTPHWLPFFKIKLGQVIDKLPRITVAVAAAAEAEEEEPVSVPSCRTETVIRSSDCRSLLVDDEKVVMDTDSEGSSTEAEIASQKEPVVPLIGNEGLEEKENVTENQLSLTADGESCSEAIEETPEAEEAVAPVAPVAEVLSVPQGAQTGSTTPEPCEPTLSSDVIDKESPSASSSTSSEPKNEVSSSAAMAQDATKRRNRKRKSDIGVVGTAPVKQQQQQHAAGGDRQLTEEQIKELKEQYVKNSHPNYKQRCVIAEIVDCSSKRVLDWFKQRRTADLQIDPKNTRLASRRHSLPPRIKLEFSEMNITILNTEFDKDPILTNERCKIISLTAGMTEFQVRAWFNSKHESDGEAQGAITTTDHHSQDSTLSQTNPTPAANQESLTQTDQKKRKSEIQSDGSQMTAIVAAADKKGIEEETASPLAEKSESEH